MDFQDSAPPLAPAPQIHELRAPHASTSGNPIKTKFPSEMVAAVNFFPVSVLVAVKVTPGSGVFSAVHGPGDLVSR
jgi:hypothetical protein